ncbi:hypothetical protein Syun_023062 [Stephania yunnanensis]|uniref:Uncharacterized protein n=1 Tax=Stephania yunnanensis TaxID=152371 RepID=A0AAP0F947_9MAGN
MESQAEALNQLTSDDLERKFALLESSSVDDDLASLKKELSGSLKVTGMKSDLSQIGVDLEMIQNMVFGLAAVNEAHCAEENRLE